MPDVNLLVYAIERTKKPTRLIGAGSKT